MKKLLFLLLAFLTTQAFSQSLDQSIREVGRRLKVTDDYSAIEGNPYFGEDFKKGTIYLTNGEVIKNLKINYNKFEERFEYLGKSDQRFAISNHKVLDKVEFDGKTFEYVEKITSDGKDFTKGYLIVLEKGKYSLYKREYTIFKEAEETMGYYQPEPARFVHKPEKYYLKTPNRSSADYIDTFRKRKFLKVHFPKNRKKLMDYIKEKNINLRNEEELVQFIKYCNANL